MVFAMSGKKLPLRHGEQCSVALSSSRIAETERVDAPRATTVDAALLSTVGDSRVYWSRTLGLSPRSVAMRSMSGTVLALSLIHI